LSKTAEPLRHFCGDAPGITFDQKKIRKLIKNKNLIILGNQIQSKTSWM